MQGATGDGGLTCTRFDDIALIWLEGQVYLNHVGVLSPEIAETTRSRVDHFRDPPQVVQSA